MFSLLNQKKKQSILHSLLPLLKVPFTDMYLNELIKHHPNSGNLLGISDILYQYNVANISLKLEHNDLTKLAPPFLTQINSTNHMEFAVVTNIDFDNVDYISEKGSKIKLLTDNFLKLWTGVVLLTEPNEKSGEKELILNRRKQFFAYLRLPFIITILLSLTAWLMFKNLEIVSFQRINYSILTLLYLAGCTVSVLLMVQTLDKNNPFINKICSLAKTNSHCNDVLESPAAKLFGVISWSEVGFVFFAGNLFCLLFTPQSVELMFWINVSALPYTIWSVYYQSRIAKQWCVFCLSIQVLLWLCFIALLTSGISFNLSDLLNIPFDYLLKSITYFVLPITGLWFIIPFIKKAKMLTPAMLELNKIKANEDIFEAVLKTQKRVAIDENVKSVVFGNPDASFIITLVTNPYCGPCARMHQKLEALLLQYDDFMQLNVVYAVSNYQTDNIKTSNPSVEKRNKAIRVLTGIFLKYGKEESIEIYKEWYDGAKKDIDSFIQKYPVDIENSQVDEIMSFHEKWCKMAHVEATPTVFINEYELPNWYKVEDLKYFIRQ